MSDLATKEHFSSIVERVKGILMSPKVEWDRIDLEAYDLRRIMVGYVLPLTAIGPIASIIGGVLFGFGGFGFVYHTPLVILISSAVVSWVLSIVSVFILAFVIDVLSPNFGGTKNFGQALKIAAYAPTAAWIAGILGLLPSLAPLVLIGALYTLYTLYLGLPRLMKAPEDKALGYTAVVIVVAIVVGFVAGLVTLPLRAGAAFGAAGLGAASVAPALGSGAKIEVNGTSFDTGKLEAASQALSATVGAAAGGAASGAASSLHFSGDQLKALLPASIAGLARTEISTESVAGATTAKAEYGSGTGGHITLEVSDLGAMGALGAMAAAVNVNSDKETPTGYDKVQTSGDRVVSESYDRASRSGKYGVLLNGKVAVEANGTGVSVDEMKAAVNAVGLDQLAAAARKT
jgi:hypothetical protein